MGGMARRNRNLRMADHRWVGEVRGWELGILLRVDRRRSGILDVLRIIHHCKADVDEAVRQRGTVQLPS